MAVGKVLLTDGSWRGGSMKAIRSVKSPPRSIFEFDPAPISSVKRVAPRWISGILAFFSDSRRGQS